MMKRLNLSFLCVALLFTLFFEVQAQTEDFDIVYGEARQGTFAGDTVNADGELFERRFLLDTQDNDIPVIRVTRISGQFTPRIRLYNANNDLVASGQGTGFPDSDYLIYEEGLSLAEGPFQIEVRATDIVANTPENPLEYSVLVQRDGQRRVDPNIDISPLPSIGIAPPPELEVGESVTAPDLNIALYGQDVTISDAPTSQLPSRVLLDTVDWTLAINQPSFISVGIISATFLDEGIGLTIRNAQRSTFFSDENFRVAYNDLNDTYTFTFTEREDAVLVTDFADVESVIVQDGIVVFRMIIGDVIKRVVFEDTDIEMRQLTSGENEARLYQISLSDDNALTTDLLVYNVLAFYESQVRVYYPNNARLISDNATMTLRRSTINADYHAINVAIPSTTGSTGATSGTENLALQIDTARLNDIVITQSDLIVEARNGTTLTEPLSTTESFLFLDGAAQVTRRDDSIRTLLPDGTDIPTPAELPQNSAALPTEDGFRTRNYNNLGADILPLCTCVGDLQSHIPVNPANGNFFYQVTDFSVLGRGLQPNLLRYYNSQDVAVSPAYFATAPQGYTRFGVGWRHSYQYELDLTGAPKDRIRFIEPDGTSHYFTPSQFDNTRWQSSTLLSVVITRQNGILGTWSAQRTDGVRYYFDRAGRLTRISETPARSIVLSEMPTIAGAPSDAGLLVVGPYGRRLELFVGESGRVETVRDSQFRTVTYAYNAENLVSIQDSRSPTQIATYSYDEFNRLIRYDDVRSPYLRVGTLAYDERGRILTFIQNPDGTLIQENRYVYNDVDRQASRVFTVSGERRVTTWQYNERWQLVNLSLPREGWNYSFSYDDTTGTLSSVRTPTQVRFNLTFDERGNLTRFEDPINTGENAYIFTYDTRREDDLSLLTSITYPNNRVERFTWERQPFPQLQSHEVTVRTGFDGISRTTSYQYDAQGRLALVIEPSNIGTLYRYDDYGYVASIWSGIEVEPDETATDITDANRAFSIANFDYTLYGQLVFAQDGRGTRFTLGYDSASGQVNRIRINDSIAYEFSYDGRGRPITVTEPVDADTSQTTSYTYNGLDAVDTITNALGGIVDYTYDEAGNIVTIVDELARTITYAYDALDNPILQRSPSGFVTQYTTELDPDGDFIIRTEIDPLGRVLERRFDSLNRLRLYRLTDGETTQEYGLSYTRTGNLATVVETSTGRALVLQYNLVGEPLSVDSVGSVTEFAYDERGLLQSVTSPEGRITRYAYDVMGNLAQVTYPDGSQWAYTYDASNNLQSALDPLGFETQYVYSPLNQLIREIDPMGNSIAYEYDARGNLQAIITAENVVQNYTYDALNRITQSVLRGTEDDETITRSTRYVYDAAGRLTNITLPNQVDRPIITYDAEDNLISFTQRGRRTSYSYDALGRIISVTDAAGHTTTYDYDTFGNIIRITDPTGTTETYTWNQSTGFLAGYTDRAGRDYEYNTDVLGRLTLLRYVRIIEGEDESTLFDAINTQITYTPDGYVSRVESGTLSSRSDDTNIRATDYAYDDNGNLMRYTDPTDGIWQLTYDAAGRVETVTNPNGVITRYTYDAVGRIVTVTHAAGDEDEERTETYEYNADGNIVAYTSAEGMRTIYTYNAVGEVRTATLAAGTADAITLTYVFDRLGQLETITYPDGSQVSYDYNSGNITDVRFSTIADDQTGESLIQNTEFEYDGVGNLNAIMLPGLSDDINISYDALDRPVRFINTGDESWAYTYDIAGNLAEISDPLGSVVSYVYDDYDRVTQLEYPSGSQVDIVYDVRGNLRAVVLPRNAAGNAQTLTYELNANRQITAMSVGSSTTTFAYDGLGNRIQRITPDGLETTYAYDTASRLVEILYDDDTGLTYSYDADGNLTQAGDITFTYDALGRPTEIGTDDSNTTILTYNIGGNVQTRENDVLGTTTYAYDGFNRLSSMSLDDAQVEIVYAPNGQIDTITRNNGIQTTISYDDVGRLDSIVHRDVNNARLDTFSYTYDPAGNVTQITRIDTNDTSTVTYSYDVDQRLISERWLNGDGETIYVVSFTYDAVGNRISENRNGRLTNYTYDTQNRLIAEARNASSQTRQFVLLPLMGIFFAGLVVHRRRKWWLIIPTVGLFVPTILAQTNAEIGVSYTYTPKGAVETITYRENDDVDVLNLTYDNENRLVAVSGTDQAGDEVNTTLTYDVFSRVRIIRTLDAEYTLYWDDHRLLGIDDGDGIDRYLWLNGTQLATLTAEGEVLWHLNDRQGSTRSFVDSTGTIVNDPSRFLEFSGFGVRIYPYSEDRIAPSGAEIAAPTLFLNGQLYEPSTGLYLLGLRAYDPTIGRFLQPDPIRQDPFSNLYTYARNRPLVFADSTGMAVETFNAPLGAAAIPQNIAPDDITPQPNIMTIPAPPSVHQRQADEAFRLLRLLMATRYGINSSTLQLSNLREQLFLQELNPVPEFAQQEAGMPLANLMDYYNSENGWQTMPVPTASTPVNPFAFLHTMETQLARAYVRPLIFCCDTPTAQDFAFVPDITAPQALSDDWQQESALFESLQPISTLPALAPEISFLESRIPTAEMPITAMPQVEVPSVPFIEPPVLDSLDNLREQTFQFYLPLWNVGTPDCEDCLPPLGFSQ